MQTESPSQEMGGIYEIVNLVNGKRYIGSAVRFLSRWSHHRSLLRRGKHHAGPLQRAWDKYGASQFIFRTIEIIPRAAPEELIAREQFHFNAMRERRYNVAPVAGSRLDVPQSEAARAAMSRFHSQHWKDPENLARRAAAISAGYTAESRARKSADATARGDGARLQAPGIHEAYWERIRGVPTGRVLSPESRAKISESNRKAWTAERRAAMSAFSSAQRASDETREKQRAAKLGKTSVKRSDPARCAKLLHDWVDGQKECKGCANIAQKASRERRRELLNRDKAISPIALSQ